jgi:hypothetical protein
MFHCKQTGFSKFPRCVILGATSFANNGASVDDMLDSCKYYFRSKSRLVVKQRVVCNAMWNLFVSNLKNFEIDAKVESFWVFEMGGFLIKSKPRLSEQNKE